ncbi:MAG: hypothetical protein IJW17_07890 [Lentisphaeria bacterium]|nr:hypothetical protein [Lentisphaeria bacterium]
MDWQAEFPPYEDGLLKFDGKAVRVSPDDAQYFFGYFDKSPWKSNGVLLAN